MPAAARSYATGLRTVTGDADYRKTVYTSAPALAVGLRGQTAVGTPISGMGIQSYLLARNPAEQSDRDFFTLGLARIPILSV